MATQCEEISLLLPWLVNGSLTAEEKLKTLEHLALCEECRRQVAAIIQIKNASLTSEKAQLDKEAVSGMFLSILKGIEYENRPEQKQVNSLQQASAAIIMTIIKPLTLTGMILGKIRGIVLQEAEKAVKPLQPVVEDLRKYTAMIAKTAEQAG